MSGPTGDGVLIGIGLMGMAILSGGVLVMLLIMIWPRKDK